MSVCLVLMVKDEEKVVGRLCASVRDHTRLKVFVDTAGKKLKVGTRLTVYGR